MKTVIIEDEKAAIRNLTALLAEVNPEIEIVATLDSISETIEWFGSHSLPDLAFMDIHLADGSAFEIFQHTDILCPVIFTTAYDEYALKAFKVNSVDYLLKPIGEEDICKALEKLEILRGKTAESPFHMKLEGLIQTLRQQESYKTHFLIPQKGDKLVPLSADSVFYFFISEGSVKAVTDQNEYILTQTLDELTETLNPARFFRVNRQYLIARQSIKDIDLWFNGRLAVNLTVRTPEKILVSKVRVTDFKEWFTRG